MQPPRRKPPHSTAEPLTVKHDGGRKNNEINNLSLLALLFSLLLFGCLIYNEAIKSIAEFSFSSPKLHQQIQNNVEGVPFVKRMTSLIDGMVFDDAGSKNGDEEVELPPEECDLFDGKWVLDNLTHPLYKESECRTLSNQVTCLTNGRKDSLFQNWKWQPTHCSLPKFKARLLLERMRNKRLLFVGDSLGRNQFQSMVCMVQSVVPTSSTKLHGSLYVVRIPDYNATIEFYWAPFLVESNGDDPEFHSIWNRLIRPESIEKHGKHWKNVDFLIFNTYIWWMNTPLMKVLRGSFEEGSKQYDEIERPIVYRRVLKTWSNWVDQNSDPNRTQVFFMSMSPIHTDSTNWYSPDGTQCAKETTPILNTSMQFSVGTDERLFAVAANVTKSMRSPVYFVNITRLSEYRKDAHASVHGTWQGKLLTPEQKANPATYSDCTHWCLPGLPDTWNEFLYARIISRST